MKTAKVSELKASISEYLSKVKAGEEVLVTDRGKPIAKIIPLKRGDIEIPAHLLTLELYQTNACPQTTTCLFILPWSL